MPPAQGSTITETAMTSPGPGTTTVYLSPGENPPVVSPTGPYLSTITVYPPGVSPPSPGPSISTLYLSNSTSTAAESTDTEFNTVTGGSRTLTLGPQSPYGSQSITWSSPSGYTCDAYIGIEVIFLIDIIETCPDGSTSM